MTPAVFLDRDGTLIQDVPYLADPALVRLLPGTVAALRRLQDAGWARVVVTNQSAIGRGFITLEQFYAVHAEFERQLTEAGVGIDAMYFCPHVPQTKSKVDVEIPDRKPGPGMLLRGAADLGLDLSRSWMIGDQLSDVKAGINAGCKGSVLVRTGHDVAPALDVLGADWPVFDDVLAFVQMILA